MPHGGARPGAGRPTTLATIESRYLQDQLRSLADQLGDDGPSILSLAIDAAKDGDLQMQRFLLQLLFSLVRPGGEDETPLQKLYNQWSGSGGVKQLHLHQHIHDKDNNDDTPHPRNDPGASAANPGHPLAP